MFAGHRTVIVCHWGRQNATKVFMIAELDGSGNNLRTFHTPDNLNDFPHVCLDSSGRVLVDSRPRGLERTRPGGLASWWTRADASWSSTAGTTA